MAAYRKNIQDRFGDVKTEPALRSARRGFGVLSRTAFHEVLGQQTSKKIGPYVRLGAVEEWEIVNGGVMDHPFHLHTNPFQIVSRDGRLERLRAWKDTVLVERGSSVRLRVRFEDFAGKAVSHCHILEHEDVGMRGIINFGGRGAAQGRPPGRVGEA